MLNTGAHVYEHGGGKRGLMHYYVITWGGKYITWNTINQNLGGQNKTTETTPRPKPSRRSLDKKGKLKDPNPPTG